MQNYLQFNNPGIIALKHNEKINSNVILPVSVHEPLTQTPPMECGLQHEAHPSTQSLHPVMINSRIFNSNIGPPLTVAWLI